MGESDFSYRLNLILAMIRHNAGVDGVTVDGDFVALPSLSGDALNGQLGTDAALSALQRLCAAHPAECRLAAAQIEHADSGYGADSEPDSGMSGQEIASIISASGTAVSSLVSAFTNTSHTTTTNTNTNTSASSSSATSRDYSLYIGGGVLLAVAALLILRK